LRAYENLAAAPAESAVFPCGFRLQAGKNAETRRQMVQGVHLLLFSLSCLF
jgi:hypothetical protein